MTKITKEQMYDSISSNLISDLYDNLNEEEKKMFISLNSLTSSQKKEVLNLTFEEIKSMMREFKEKDNNSNNSLNRKEFQSVVVSENHNKEAFNSLDIDQNKKIDFAEYIRSILPE
jgi:hypothetical protein